MAKEGDHVRIVTRDETIEGILIPRPPILDDDVTVVKLDSGYNVGIENKKIKEIRVLEKPEAKKKAKIKIKHNKALPTVTILSTGGTISSRVDYRTGGTYANLAAEDFLQMYPELESIANIKAEEVMQIMSEDMVPEDWSNLAKRIVKELNSGVDGVVVTQGTDTLHFSTAALSFFLKDLNKPVVFTAAQRSIDRGSSDAYMNLVCSVIAAKSEIAEVMTCMHGTSDDDYCLFNRGTKVRKMHTSRRDAFRSINEKALAKVFPNGKLEVVNKDYRKRNKGKVGLDDKFEEKTALIQVYPGMDPEIIDFYVKKGYKGIVLAATALGHIPTLKKNYSLMPNIQKAIDKKIPVVIASQTLYGRAHPYAYTNLRKLSLQLKCIFVEDMLPETAYIKLAWVLGHTKDMKKVRELMQTSIAGEITERTEVNTFLI